MTAEFCRRKFTRHGHARQGRMTRTYRSWVHMVARCTNPNAPNYARYGGRGISVCARWALFDNFLADMGERPLGTSLERRNNDDGYHRSNCEWASPKKQANNTSWNRLLTHAGETHTVAQWAAQLGIPVGTIHSRLTRGASVSAALNPHNARPRRAK